MSFIGLFLKSIFIMVLMIAVFLIGIISFLYLRVKRMTKQFRNGTNSNANRNNTRRQQQNTTSGSTKRRSAEYDDGVVVEEELYDERSPRQANRKIFAKDEGEYVEFEEEKEKEKSKRVKGKKGYIIHFCVFISHPPFFRLFPP